MMKKYINGYRNLVQNNNALKFAVIALAVIIFIEGVFIIKAFNAEKVIVVPNVNGKYVISQTGANPRYLKGIGVYLVGLAENFTPQNIGGNYKEFLNYASSGSFGNLQASFVSGEKTYKRNDASSFFAVKSVKLLPGKIVVTGNKRLIIGTSVVSSKMLQATLNYKIINGEFEVTGYVEKNINFLS